MSESAGKAVFVSYASQDAEAARRIAEALRQGGVEVWLDQEGGLVGGDVWDRKIREQIHSCALFVPIISANTQARHEGYFRLEWKLAEDRSHLIAKGKPFIVPVSVDATTERGALVPDAFLAVQWTKLPGGEAPAAFVARVMRLLSGPTSEPVPSTGSHDTKGKLTSTPPSVPIRSSEVTARNLELSAAVRPVPEAALETFERQRPLWRRALPVVSGIIVTALVGGLVAWRLWPTAAPAPVTRISYRLPEGQTFRAVLRNPIAVSPDGRKFVYNTTGGLYLRSLDELEARVIPGTPNALVDPFFSPDGQSVGYWQAGQLMRIAIGGGAPVVIATTRLSPNGGSWTPDGTILFAETRGILSVPATGGTPVVVIPASTGQWLWSPQLLPGGDTVLFTERPIALTANNEGRIVAQKISTGERKVLVQGGSDAHYLSTGHLVYAVGNVLTGVAFDPRRLAVIGGSVPVVQGVMRSGLRNLAHYGVSAGGTLVWVHSAVVARDQNWKLALSDLAGKLVTPPLALPAGPYEAPRVSPDGLRIALGVADSKEAYVAIYDLDGKTALRRLTFGGNSRNAIWSRDGEHVAFQSDREGDLAIFWQRADGNGPAERLTKPEKDTAHVPASWSPKDETLLFTVVPANDHGAPGALWTFTRASGTTAPFGGVKGAGQSPSFSPDGRWVAYARGLPSGSFIQPFPATGALYQLPRIEGGNAPLNPFWSPDGTMLFFASGGSLFSSVAVTTQPTVTFGNPNPVPRLFPPGNTITPRHYDIMPDGRMIGLIAPEQAAAATAESGQPEIRIVLNWTEELKRLVPVK